jgi:xanthine permease XanP
LVLAFQVLFESLFFLNHVSAIGRFFRSLPNPVLGGATIVMFGTVAAAGVNMIASMGRLGRREILIIAVSLGIGLAFVPEILNQTPKAIQHIFGSAITSGGLAALSMNMVLPQQES